MFRLLEEAAGGWQAQDDLVIEMAALLREARPVMEDKCCIRLVHRAAWRCQDVEAATVRTRVTITAPFGVSSSSSEQNSGVGPSTI